MSLSCNGKGHWMPDTYWVNAWKWYILKSKRKTLEPIIPFSPICLYILKKCYIHLNNIIIYKLNFPKKTKLYLIKLVFFLQISKHQMDLKLMQIFSGYELFFNMSSHMKLKPGPTHAVNVECTSQSCIHISCISRACLYYE